MSEDEALIRESALADLAHVSQQQQQPCAQSTSFLKCPDITLPEHVKTYKPEDNIKLEDYIKGLLPVHSCSAEALESILEDGALVARAAESNRKLGAPSGHKGIFEQLNEPEHFDKFMHIFAKLRCQCRRCLNLVLNVAEVDILAHRFGDTWAGRFRRECFMHWLSFLEPQDWQYSDEPHPLGPRADEPTEDEMKWALDQIPVVAAALAETMDPPGFGIRFWADEALGLSQHNFAVLGPNAHYGPISLIFDETALHGKYGDCDMIVNAAACFISGAAYELRPWSVVDKLFDVGSLSPGPTLCHFKHYWYSHCGQRASLSYDHYICAVKEAVNSYRVAGLHVEGSSEYFAKEIFGQAQMAFSNVPLDIDLVDAAKAWCDSMTEEQRHSVRGSPVDHKDYCKYMETSHRKHNKKGIIAGSVMPDSTFEEPSRKAIEWYENVNVHGRVEVHLPTRMPLERCLCAVISKSARVEATTLAKLRQHVKHVVFVDGEVQSLEFQKQLFRIRGQLQSPRQPVNKESKEETVPNQGSERVDESNADKTQLEAKVKELEAKVKELQGKDSKPKTQEQSVCCNVQ